MELHPLYAKCLALACLDHYGRIVGECGILRNKQAEKEKVLDALPLETAALETLAKKS